MPHFRVLEFWRLSAAMIVMTYHFLRYAPESLRGVEEVLHRLFPLMDMFFMVSGFVIMLRYGDRLLADARSYWHFIAKRIARIYPVYLVTLAFFVAVALAAQMLPLRPGWEERYDFSVLPHNLLLVQAWGTTEHLTFNYVAWTLSAEWFCYLAFPLVVVAFHLGRTAGLVALTAVTIALLELTSVRGMIPDGHWLTSEVWGAFRAFADFSAGALVAVSLRSTSWKLRSHLPGWLMIALAVAAMLSEQNPYLVLVLLGLSVFVASVAERNNPDAALFLRPTQPLGRVSFGIYILHPVVEVVFLSVIWRMVVEPTGAVGFLAFLPLPMVVSLGIALASERWFQQPMGNAIVGGFERWIERRRPATPAE